MTWLIWPLAMLAILPFMRWGPSLRVWSVMIASSLVTWWFHGPVAYMVIDLLAALLITTWPRGDEQRAIGSIYSGMVFFHIGYLFTPQDGGSLHASVMIALGWVQWAILLSWGVLDAMRENTGLGLWVNRSLPDTIKARL